MELVNGRPEDTAGRLEKEIRTYDFLDSLGVAYQRIDHEAAMTMEGRQFTGVGKVLSTMRGTP